MAWGALAWLCLAAAAMAQAPSTSTLSFPPLTGRVVDDAGLLSAGDRAALDTTLARLEAKTTNQLVVVTLKSLQGSAIEDYGYQLGRRWQIGQKDKNSGALLIVAPAERKVRIEVGYGLEGTLTDAATRLIIENAILPAFKTGDFPAGIKAGTALIAQLLGGDAGAGTGQVAPSTVAPSPAAPSEVAGARPVWPAVLLALAVVAFVIFCAVSRGMACRAILQVMFFAALSGRNNSSGGSSSFSGGGGSFGGGGSSGSW